VLNTISLPPIVAYLKEALQNVDAIYMFGTRVDGKIHPSSDLDLAVIAQKPIATDQLWALSGKLANIAQCDVDLIDLSAASTVMRLQIIANGKRLYSRDERKCALFEDFVFPDYARLNEERAEILKDIALRGSVYG